MALKIIVVICFICPPLFIPAYPVLLLLDNKEKVKEKAKEILNAYSEKLRSKKQFKKA